jgi:hypothetical protein
MLKKLLLLSIFAIAGLRKLVRAQAPGSAGDGRCSDRAEVRAHIDRIFQTFIKKDAAERRHAWTTPMFTPRI